MPQTAAEKYGRGKMRSLTMRGDVVWRFFGEQFPRKSYPLVERQTVTMKIESQRARGGDYALFGGIIAKKMGPAAGFLARTDLCVTNGFG
jgi:hypothetical protein